MADAGQPVTAWKNVLIAGGQSLSEVLNVAGWDVVAIEVPADTEGTSVTAQGSFDGTTFLNLQTDTAEWSVVAAAGQIVMLPQDKRLRGLTAIKVRSGSSATPAVQSANATLKIALAPMSG